MKNSSLWGMGGMFVALLFLAGCETTAGVGRDLEAAGEGIEETAEEHQPYGDQARYDEEELDQAELD